MKMTIAYWSILFITLYPYFFVFLAKTGKDFTNQKPREYLAKLKGWKQKAHWIEINSYEILPAYVAAVLISQHLMGHLHQHLIDMTAIIFVLSRIGYAIAYLTNKSTLRTACWFVGFVGIIYLYILAGS